MCFRPGLWASCLSKHLLQGVIPLESSQPHCLFPFRSHIHSFLPSGILSFLTRLRNTFLSLPHSIPFSLAERLALGHPSLGQRGSGKEQSPYSFCLPRKVILILNPRTESGPMERGGPDSDLVLSTAQRNEVGRGARESLSPMAGHQHLRE